MALMNYRIGNEARILGIRPGHNGEQILVRADVIGGTATVYTVPAGKIAFITHIAAGVSNDVTGLSYVGIQNTVPATIWFAHIGYSIAQSCSFYDNASYYPPIELPTGYSIFIHSGSAGLDSWCSIHGWEE